MRLISTKETHQQVFLTRDAWDTFKEQGEAHAILRKKFHPGRNVYVILDVMRVTEVRL